MNYLWSPWRMDYIKNHMKSEGCVFCTAASLPDSPKNLIVHRGEYSFVILNRYPYTSGHLMVVPYAHVDTLEALPAAARAEMMELVTRAMGVLRGLYHPQAFNVGANIGAAAGAGIAEHVHMHIVPRWSGDTNFMSTLAETRVLPEALDETFARVQAAWPRGAAPAPPAGRPKE